MDYQVTIRIASATTILCLINTFCFGADDAPSKPNQQLELPFLDRAPVSRGWVGFSPTGGYLAAYYCRRDQSYVAIWDTRSGRLIEQVKVGLGEAYMKAGPPAAFTPTESHFAYLVPEEIRFYPLKTNQKSKGCSLPKREGKSEIPPSEYTSIVALDEKEIQQLTYSAAKGTLRRDLCEVGSALRVMKTNSNDLGLTVRLAVSPDCGRVAWVPEGGLAEALDPPKARTSVNILDFGMDKVIKLSKEGAQCSALAFSPDGKQVACGNGDGSLTVWDLANEKEAYTIALPKPSWSVWAVAFSPDGNWLAYSSTSGLQKGSPNVWVVSRKSGKVRWSWADNEVRVMNLCWHPKSTQLATLGVTKVTVYDVLAEK